MLGEQAGVDGFDLIRVDSADQDLVEGNPRHPRRQVLRAKIGDGPQHRPRGFANIHDFAAVEQDKNPAAEAFGDIGKILEFHSATMTDSEGMSSPEDFDAGAFQKLISVWEGLCARPRDKILGHPVWGGPLVVEMRQCGGNVRLAWRGGN